MRIIKELKAEKELTGYKPVFAVNNKVTKHGLVSIGRFGLLSTNIYGNGAEEWYYAVKLGDDATNGKTQVYRLIVNKLGQVCGLITTEYFVKVKKNFKARVYSVNDIVAEHGLEPKFFGSTMFGLLEPDALYGDGKQEWTYGVELYSKVKDELTPVYKLIIVSGR